MRVVLTFFLVVLPAVVAAQLPRPLISPVSPASCRRWIGS